MLPYLTISKYKYITISIYISTNTYLSNYLNIPISNSIKV